MNHHKVKVAVHLLLLDKKKLLFLRRKNSGYMDGFWGLPAGHVEECESAIEAMIRETREEIGLELTENQLRCVGTMHHLKPGTSDYVHFFFDVKSWMGEPHNCEPDKCSELGWFRNVPEDVVPYIGQYINEAHTFSVFKGL